MTDDDTERMSALFDRAMDTGPANAALDRLIYCHLLDRMTDGNVELAMEEFGNPGTREAARREMQSLSRDDLEELGRTVTPMWCEALSHAVKVMWHACRRLGYDPDGLGPDHIALLGALFLGELSSALARDDPES